MSRVLASDPRGKYNHVELNDVEEDLDDVLLEEGLDPIILDASPLCDVDIHVDENYLDDEDDFLRDAIDRGSLNDKDKSDGAAAVPIGVTPVEKLGDVPQIIDASRHDTYKQYRQRRNLLVMIGTCLTVGVIIAAVLAFSQIVFCSDQDSVHLVVVGADDVGKNDVDATPLLAHNSSSSSAFIMVPPPPLDLDILCDKTMVGTDAGYSACRKACEPSDCCNANGAENCRNDGFNNEVCDEYYSCFNAPPSLVTVGREEQHGTDNQTFVDADDSESNDSGNAKEQRGQGAMEKNATDLNDASAAYSEEKANETQLKQTQNLEDEQQIESEEIEDTVATSVPSNTSIVTAAGTSAQAQFSTTSMASKEADAACNHEKLRTGGPLAVEECKMICAERACCFDPSDAPFHCYNEKRSWCDEYSVCMNLASEWDSKVGGRDAAEAEGGD